jgi:RND family efflux transporter MFP subunit
MNSLSAVVKKSVLPVFGLLLTLAVIFQIRGQGPSSLPFLEQLGAAPAAAETTQAPAPTHSADRVVAEGRMVTYPGAEVEVAADLSGTLVRFLVKEQDEVRKGQLIAELKADDLRAEIAEARARIAEAEADIRFADADAQRADRLLAEKVGTPENVDRARRNREAAYARRATAVASVERLEAVLAKTRIVAPISGVVVTRFADAGERLEAGAPLVTIANLKKTRVEAEVDEFDAGRVKLGAPVTVTAEGFSGQSWKGTVEEIPDAVLPRRLKPQDPGRPSDTRVLLVKVALTEPTPLKLGQRVEIAMD